MTLRIFPVFPRSSPEITTTWSFFAKCGMTPSDHFRRERDDLHELALAQLARHGAENARPLGLLLVVDQHGGVLVEADVGAVLATNLLHRTNQNRLVHVTLLDLGPGE